VTNDPTQPQPNPFPAPEPGPVAGQPAPYPSQPPRPAMGQPTYASPGQPALQGQPVVPSFIPPSVASAAANPKRRGGSPAGTLAFVVAVVVAAAGLGFAGGRLTAPAAATTRGGFTGQNGGTFPGANPNASGNPNRGGFGGIGGAFAGAVSIDGQVTSVANGSITVQTSNGQSVTLQVPSTATYHAQAPATSSDVAVGSQVQVSVSRPNGRAEGSAQPGASGQPGQGGQGALGFTVTDITVVGK
jgi:hypothetical protein